MDYTKIFSRVTVPNRPHKVGGGGGDIWKDENARYPLPSTVGGGMSTVGGGMSTVGGGMGTVPQMEATNQWPTLGDTRVSLATVAYSTLLYQAPVLRIRIRGIRIISLDPDPYKKMAGSGIRIRIK